VLIAGSPAKIIKEDFPKPLDNKTRELKINNIFNEFWSYLKYNGYNVSMINKDHDSSFRVEIKKENKTHLVEFHKSEQKLNNKVDLLVVDYKQISEQSAKMQIDLNHNTRRGSSMVGEEFISFISRYGVRFDRLD
jgi:hypothetical protein